MPPFLVQPVPGWTPITGPEILTNDRMQNNFEGLIGKNVPSGIMMFKSEDMSCDTQSTNYYNMQTRYGIICTSITHNICH